MKRLFTKLLATILTVSLLLSPVGALADIDEVIVADGVDAAVDTVEEELALETEDEPSPAGEAAAPVAEAPAAEEPTPAVEEPAPAAEEPAPAAEDPAPAAEAQNDAEGEPSSEGDSTGEPTDEVEPASEDGSDEVIYTDVEDAVVPEAVDTVVEEAAYADLPEVEVDAENGLEVVEEAAADGAVFSGEQGQYPDGVYNITIAGSDYGAVYATTEGFRITTADEGWWIKLEYEPESGYRLGSVEVMYNGQAINEEGQLYFGMPAGDVTVYATFVSATEGQHQIEIADCENATVKASVYGFEVASANVGEYVDIEIRPVDGYHVKSVSATCDGAEVPLEYCNPIWGMSGREGMAYSYIMPDGVLSVSVTLTQGMYDITFAPTENGSVTASVTSNYGATKADQGEIVELSAEGYPWNEYRPKSLRVMCGDAEIELQYDEEYEVYSFVMPDGPVTVSATFIGVDQGNLITFNNEYAHLNVLLSGFFSWADAYRALEGETVNISFYDLTPGYSVSDVTVTCNGNPVEVVGDKSGRNGRFSFTMPEDSVEVTITATDSSEPLPVAGYTVTTVVNGSGTVDAPAGATANDEVTFTATPDEGWIVDNIEVKRGETVVPTEYADEQYSFTMPAGNVTITANFIEGGDPTASYELTFDLDDEKGSYHVLNEGLVLSAVATGTTVNFTVTPEEGYAVGSVSAADQTIAADSNGTYSYTMPDSDATISVTFEPVHTLTTVVNGNGSIIAPESAKKGAVVEFYITPDEGWIEDSIQVTCNNVEVDFTSNDYSGYQMIMPDGDVIITGSFRLRTDSDCALLSYADYKRKYDITVSANGNVVKEDYINGSYYQKGYMVKEGDEITVTVAPKPGFVLTSAVIEGAEGDDITLWDYDKDDGIATAQTATFTKRSGDEDIFINTSRTDESLELDFGSGGSVSIAIDGVEQNINDSIYLTAEVGSTVTITATPDEGYCVMSGGIVFEESTNRAYDVYFDNSNRNIYTDTVTFEYYKINTPQTVSVVFRKIQEYSVTIREDEQTITYTTEDDPEYFTVDGGKRVFILPDYPFGEVPDGKAVRYGVTDGYRTYYYHLDDNQPDTIIDVWLEDCYYTIDVETSGNGGVVTPNVKNAFVGERVTLTVEPVEGYFLESMTVRCTNVSNTTARIHADDEGDPNKFWFGMPRYGSVIIEASFANRATTQLHIDCDNYGDTDDNTGHYYRLQSYVNGEQSSYTHADQEVTIKVEKGARTVVDEIEVGYTSQITEEYISVPVNKIDDETYTFTMPNESVDVEAKYSFAGNHTITLAVQGKGTFQTYVNQNPETTADSGDRVSLRYETDGFYRFDKYVVMFGNERIQIVSDFGDDYFTMPDGDVIVTAYFVPWNTPYNYTITTIVEGNNASGTIVAPEESAEGEKVTVNVTPDDGCAVDSLTVEYYDEEIETTCEDGVYTFTMPGGPVTITATFVQTSGGNSGQGDPNPGGQTGPLYHEGNGPYTLVWDDAPVVVGESKSFTLSYGKEGEDWSLIGVSATWGEDNASLELTANGNVYSFTVPNGDVHIYVNLQNASGQGGQSNTRVEVTNYNEATYTLASDTVTSIMFAQCPNLVSIDLSGCPNLVDVNFEWNTPNVKSLDVSGCTELTKLQSRCAALETLDVSHNTKLKYLDCNNNNLRTLDLSHNPLLESLACQCNNLTTLDLSGCPEIVQYIEDKNKRAITSQEGDSYIMYMKGDSDYEFALACDDGLEISLVQQFAITTAYGDEGERRGEIHAPASAPKGKTVTVWLEAYEGYGPKGIAVKDADDQDITVTPVTNSDDSYTFTMPEKAVTVTGYFKKVPTATLTPAEGLTYDGTEQELLTAASTDGGTLNYSLDGETWAGTIPKGKDAGEYSVYYKVVGNDDFTGFEAEEPVAVTIARKKATLTVVNNNTKVYGDEDPVPGYTVEGNVNGESLTGTLSRVEGENVKRYAYKLGDLAEKNPNYDITVEGTLTIYAKEVVLEWSSDQALTYNGKAQLPTATVTNLKAGDECNVIVVADENDNATDAGNHTAVAVSLSNANYKLPAAENAYKHSYEIAKADHENVENALTITVSSLGATGTADLSQCIPEDAEWSVNGTDELFTSATKGEKRTLDYVSKAADAGTSGIVTVQVEAKNYNPYTVGIEFVTSDSDVFTLSFDSKGGEPMDSRRLQTGAPYGELPVLSRDFYTFDGWFDSAGTKVEPINEMGAGDATVFACWTANSYKVKLELGEHGTLPAEYQNGEKTFTIETEAFALPKLDDVPANADGKVYTFSGWTLTGEDTAYIDVTIDPAVVLPTLTGDATTITYTAKWTEGTMVGAVSYTKPDDDQSGILGLKDMNANGGEVSTSGSGDATNLAEALKQIAADNSAKENQGTEIDKVTVDMKVSAQNIDKTEKDGILLKVEQPKDEDVDVKTDFIKIDVTQTTSYTTVGTENKEETLTDLKRVVEIPLNYDMTGRYNLRLYRRHTNEAGETETTELRQLTSKPKSSKNMEDGTFFVSGYGRTAVIYIYSSLFSTFAMSSDNVESYEVVFNSNGGTAVDTQKVYKDKKVTKPANPTKAATATTEYTFDKWCIDKALTTEYDFNKEVTEGFTLYARWIEKAKEKKTNNPAPAVQASTASPAPAIASAPAAPAEPAITIPKTPAGVKAKAAKKGKVTVSWKKIKKNKKTKALLKQIKGIEVQYSTDPTFTTDVQTKNLGKKKTKVTLKGLQKKTVYYVRVRYTDGAGGVSAWSAVKKVKTKNK